MKPRNAAGSPSWKVGETLGEKMKIHYKINSQSSHKALRI